MAEKKCTGDCIQCSFQQQVYCAAQHGHAILAAIPVLIEKLDALTAAPSSIINPLEKAHEGPGAENRGSDTKY